MNTSQSRTGKLDYRKEEIAVTNEEWFLKQGRPLMSSTILAEFIQGAGVQLGLLGSTLSITWPGFQLHRRNFDKAVRASSTLAASLGVPLIPHSSDPYRHPLHRNKPRVRVRLVRRERPNWLVGFWCPFCFADHFHHWLAGYDPVKAYHRGAHCLSHTPFYESGGYFMELDEHARDLLRAETETSK